MSLAALGRLQDAEPYSHERVMLPADMCKSSSRKCHAFPSPVGLSELLQHLICRRLVSCNIYPSQSCEEGLCAAGDRWSTLDSSTDCWCKHSSETWSKQNCFV